MKMKCYSRCPSRRPCAADLRAARDEAPVPQRGERVHGALVALERRHAARHHVPAFRLAAPRRPRLARTCRIPQETTVVLLYRFAVMLRFKSHVFVSSYT